MIGLLCLAAAPALPAQPQPLIFQEKKSEIARLPWHHPSNFLPSPESKALKVRVNLIILQRADGSGNFQDNAADRAFLHNMVSVTNQVFANLVDRNEEYYPSQNLPFLPDAKIEIVPRVIFRKDERGWNNRNDTNHAGVPYRSGWYLNEVDSLYYHDPSLPKAINLYFSTDGQLYEEMVVAKTTTDYNSKVFFKQHAASEIPHLNLSRSTLANQPECHTMRCHIGNVWLKLWWKRHVLQEPDWTMEYEVGKSIAHELGHLMGLGHTPDSQTHALMRTRFGGQRDYLSVQEIAKIHQSFALFPSLWQFVEDGAHYGPASARLVSQDETWNIPVRLYSNLVVQAGARLTIMGTVFMPPGSSITVEPGAELMAEDGVVKFWE